MAPVETSTTHDKPVVNSPMDDNAYGMMAAVKRDTKDHCSDPKAKAITKDSLDEATSDDHDNLPRVSIENSDFEDLA